MESPDIITQKLADLATQKSQTINPIKKWWIQKIIDFLKDLLIEIIQKK